jgi:hypothetical protein
MEVLDGTKYETSGDCAIEISSQEFREALNQSGVET